ncbi:hypothetical protein [Priestia megaterium]|uniref:hypothetical protein n=1 Tax=Priestia megaterium TaxID=1404 RepID=UPI0011B7B4A1|nr:hypothetical protein [Priestia megaterium]QDZ88634.1 hypothetical protein D0441_30800 [Priestia megaterium]
MRKLDVEIELQTIINSFDLFVSDFFNWVLSQDPEDPNLKDKIRKEDSSLGKVARRTSVKEFLISFVKCPDRNLIYFLYFYYIKNYQNIINGIPSLSSNFSKETKDLLENCFKYFYETLVDKKTFQQNYLPTYNGPQELKREIRKRFGKRKVCPYCDYHNISHEDYSSIDHFLPKSRFPFLSIFS